MKKQEYLSVLQQELSGCPDEDKRDILDTFAEHFAEGTSRGLSEEQIAEELGDAFEVAANIRNMMDSPADPDVETVHGSAAAPDPEAEQFSAPVSDSGVRQNDTESASFGTMNTVPCLTIEAIHTSTDIHLTPGEKLTWHLEAREGITIGNGLFIRAGLFGRKQKAEVFFDSTDAESRITVQGAGGDLYVEVPETVTRLHVRLSSGDLEMTDLSFDSVRARSSSGDLQAQNCRAGELRLESVSGDIAVRGLSAESMELYSVSGDIEAAEISGNVQMRTASGDITIEHHVSGVLTASSKSGDLKIRSAGVIRAKSISGDIHLDLPEETEQADAATTSGDVRCEVPGSDFTAELHTISGSIRNKTAVLGRTSGKDMYLGQGRMRLHLQSVSGDLILKNL